VRWFFGATNREPVSAQLAAAGLEVPHVDQMMATFAPAPGENGSYVTPPEDVILAMNTSTRGQLYSFLGQWPQNTEQYSPTRYDERTRVDWFGSRGLPDHMRAVIEPLLFTWGNLRMFADCRTVLTRYPSPEDQRTILRVLSRQPSIMCRVRVEDATDVDALVAYWGEGGHDHDVRPVLESARDSNPHWDVGLTLLLPPLPRSHLYHYRGPADPSFPDCHWTSFNFFNDPPDPRFSDMSFCKKALEADYVQVQRDFRLGDLILITDQKGLALHTCNYVAGNVIFTKNGGSLIEPWILSHLEDMLSCYALRGDLTVNYYRLRSAPGAVTVN
jgi:hypothetical protein